MHRYQRDLLARLRTDYVHEQQERYRTQLAHLADAIDHAGLRACEVDQAAEKDSGSSS